MAEPEPLTAAADLDLFDFAKPEGSEAEMFIQWKGTDVCLDFRCPCGAGGHVDGYFAYAIKCAACGAVYRMGTQVIAKRNDALTQYQVAEE